MESNLTEAQQILKDLIKIRPKILVTQVAVRLQLVDDPIKADTFVKDLYEQTKTNYGQCVLDWTMEITDRIIKYIKK